MINSFKENYGCLDIKTNSSSTNIEDRLFWYKAANWNIQNITSNIPVTLDSVYISRFTYLILLSSTLPYSIGREDLKLSSQNILDAGFHV
jgi:hypothetical protein